MVSYGLFTLPMWTRQNCLVLLSWRYEHNWTPDKTVLSCLQLCSHCHRNKTRQFCHVSIVFTPPMRTHRNWDEMRQNCLVLSPLCSHRQCGLIETGTRRDKTVLSRRVGSVNKPLQFPSPDITVAVRISTQLLKVLFDPGTSFIYLSKTFI